MTMGLKDGMVRECEEILRILFMVGDGRKLRKDWLVLVRVNLEVRVGVVDV